MTTFDYLPTGHTGTRSTKVSVSGYASGASDWAYAPQATTPGHYRFTDWYQSNVATEVDAAVTMTDGTTKYFYLGSVAPSAVWAQYSREFDVPVGASRVTVFHLIAANGYLVTDDTAFALYQTAPFTRGLVTLTFDDGWRNQYQNAFPLLKQYGLTGTFYILSGELFNQPAYMTVAEITALRSAGNEVASHSVSHPDFTKLTTTQRAYQFSQSKSTLSTKFGPVTNFAYPYGAYNATTLAEGATYYKTQRSTDTGFNTRDTINYANLVVQNVFSTTTPAQVQAWVDQAARDRSWLILVYHEVAVTPIAAGDEFYTTSPADFSSELGIVKRSGLGIVTVAQAVAELSPQLVK